MNSSLHYNLKYMYFKTDIKFISNWKYFWIFFLWFHCQVLNTQSLVYTVNASFFGKISREIFHIPFKYRTLQRRIWMSISFFKILVMRDVDWLKANQTQTEFSGEQWEELRVHLASQWRGWEWEIWYNWCKYITTVAVLSHKRCMSQFKISFMSVNICLW